MSEWMPIESAPKDGTVILAYHATWASWKSVMWLGDRSPHDGCPWVETGYTIAWPVESFWHWMPSPPPPSP
jgi:hypothetical protein